LEIRDLFFDLIPTNRAFVFFAEKDIVCNDKPVHRIFFEIAKDYNTEFMPIYGDDISQKERDDILFEKQEGLKLLIGTIDDYSSDYSKYIYFGLGHICKYIALLTQDKNPSLVKDNFFVGSNRIWGYKRRHFQIVNCENLSSFIKDFIEDYRREIS